MKFMSDIKQIFNFDYMKSYATHDRLMKALDKIEGIELRDCLPIVIPYGKNEGRHTAIIRFSGGKNQFMAHHGFMVFG